MATERCQGWQQRTTTRLLIIVSYLGLSRTSMPGGSSTVSVVVSPIRRAQSIHVPLLRFYVSSSTFSSVPSKICTASSYADSGLEGIRGGTHSHTFVVLASGSPA